MSTSSDYDFFADVYHIWARSAPTTERNLPFYVDEYVRTPGVVVELGVGNGRIAVEAAKRGKAIIGVDSSLEMLKRCRQRAEDAGVVHLLTLIHADFRDFILPEPAQLITIPFHTIGHLLHLDDKRAGLQHIYEQLAPGGQLIFDHFIFDPEMARQHQGVGLRAEYTDEDTGRDVLMWTTTRYDYEAQTMRIIVWTDELADDGTLQRRKYRRLNFSWLEPQQARALLEDTGFEIVALYGEFDRRPFDGRSTEQVWVARKPG